MPGRSQPGAARNRRAQRLNRQRSHSRAQVALEDFVIRQYGGEYLIQLWTLIQASFQNLYQYENNDNIAKKNDNVDEREREIMELAFNIRFFRLNFCLIFTRFASVLLVLSVFVPDEYWQGTEVAHWILHKRGYLTWEWAYGLRGYLYPCFLAIPGWVMKQMEIASPLIKELGPRFLQVAVNCLAEVKFLSYVRKKFGNETGIQVFKLFMCNWFLLYCGARTLTNTMEMSLGLLAFSYFQTDSIIQATICATLAFFVRPTSVVLWIPICFWVVSKIVKDMNSLISFVVIGSTLFYCNSILDIHFYKRFILPSWKFFQFNFLEGKSAEFGVHPFLWYLYSAIPSIFLVLTPWVILLVGLWPNKYYQHLKISFFYIAMFSFIGHKEIRFLLPIIPHLLVVIGDLLVCIERTGKCSKTRVWEKVRTMTQIGYAMNVIVFVFVALYHQVGIKPAALFINSDTQSPNLTAPKIWIMMPCFSVPVYSYMPQTNATFEFLTCSPPGYEFSSVNQLKGDFIDFNLTEFTELKLSQDDDLLKTKPDYVMSYDRESTKMVAILKSYGLVYDLVGDYYHTIFPFDNIGGRVHLLRFNSSTAVPLSSQQPPPLPPTPPSNKSPPLA